MCSFLFFQNDNRISTLFVDWGIVMPPYAYPQIALADLVAVKKDKYRYATITPPLWRNN